MGIAPPFWKFPKQQSFALLVFAMLVVSEASASGIESSPAIRIARFSSDCAAAISYTFDDGLRDQYTHAVPMLNEVGFKGTFFVIPGKISDTVKDAEARQNDKRAWGTICWFELKSMSAQGHEIANHTWSHRSLSKLSADEVATELAQSRAAIKIHIGIAPLTVAFPFNQSTPEIRAVTLKEHVAFRSYQTGVGGKDTAASLNAWADKQLRENKWGIIMAHGIVRGYAAFTDPEIFRTHLRYVKTREREIWVDTFSNIARYEHERDDATLTIFDSSSGRVACKLTGTLDAATYDIPLTLVVDIPRAKSVRAERAGHSLPVRISTESIQIDAAPSSIPITITWQQSHD